MSQVSLVDTSDRLTEEYLDRFEGVRSEILNATRFDENSDLSTTYLGRSRMVRDHKIVAEERFSMSGQGYTMGKLLDGTECQILLDTGVSKPFMSKSHYLHCKSLHLLPKFTSKQIRQWTICKCTFCHSHNNRHTWSQICNIHISIWDTQECRYSFRN